MRAGLGIVEALGQLNARLEQAWGVRLAVRLGIHTGLVVVGEVGSGTRQEQLALGETPNLAARLQGIAAPDTVVISAATLPLLGGFFACQSLGTPLLRGFAQPLEVHQVLYESMARSRLDAAGSTDLIPLVGREQEMALLLERWAQVKDGLGQVVLLSGEAGIGKSRLVQVLKEHVATEPQTWLFLGALPAARTHLEEGIALYTPDQRRAPVLRIGVDLGVNGRLYAAMTLWLLGYSAQARARLHESLALAQELAHPYSLGWTWICTAIVSQFRRDVPAVHEQAKARAKVPGTSCPGSRVPVRGRTTGCSRRLPASAALPLSGAAEPQHSAS